VAAIGFAGVALAVTAGKIARIPETQGQFRPGVRQTCLVGSVSSLQEIRRRSEIIAFSAISLLHLGYVFFVTTPLIHADEAAYLLKGAALAGYSTQGASIYDVGFGVLLAPLFVAFDDPETIYRFCLILNAIFATLNVVIVYRILLAHSAIDWHKALCVSLIAALYPAFFAYTTTAQPEILLALLFLTIAYCMLLVMKSTGSRWLLLIVWAVSTGAIIVVQQRGIAVAVPSIIVATFLLARERRWLAIGIWLSVVAAVLVGGGILWRYAQNQLSIPAQSSLWSVESANYAINHKTSQLFLQLGEFLLTLLGQIAYLIVATFGMIVLAIVRLARNIQFGPSFATRTFSGFALGVLLLNVIMSSFFVYSSPYIDHAIYGRYNEAVLPLFLAIGLSVLDRSAMRSALAAFVVSVVVLVSVVAIATHAGGSTLNVHNIMSIFWLEQSIELRQFGRIFLFVLLFVVAFGVVQQYRWWLAVVGALFALQTLDVGANFLDRSSRGREVQRQIVHYLRSHASEGTCVTMQIVPQSSQWAHWNYKYFLLGYPIREMESINAQELCSPWVISADPAFAASFPQARMILRETEQPERLWYLEDRPKSPDLTSAKSVADQAFATAAPTARAGVR